MCVFNPVTDDSTILTDVVLKALQEKQNTMLLIYWFLTVKVDVPVCRV